MFGAMEGFNKIVEALNKFDASKIEEVQTSILEACKRFERIETKVDFIISCIEVKDGDTSNTDLGSSTGGNGTSGCGDESSNRSN